MIDFLNKLEVQHNFYQTQYLLKFFVKLYENQV